MQFLYDIIINPLLFVYDLLFTILYRAFQNPVTSIVALSVIINLVVLPLYNKADAMQKEEQAKKKAMDPWVRHIRKHFRGDEQFMMLSAYYKVEHYSPLSFVKEAVPLLLQIPFFMAAYRFLSELDILDGAAWGPIRNLIEPDGLLRLGTLTVNLLPIVMTGINLLSGAIYAKGSTLRLKLQILISALLFLVLLYQSPAGLVVYWTMNNLFSLAKNLMVHVPEKLKKFLKAVAALYLIYVVENCMIHATIHMMLGETILVGAALYLIYQLSDEKIRARVQRRFPRLVQILASPAAVFGAETILGVLLGCYIPSSVLASAARQFVNSSTGQFPYVLLTQPTVIYLGLFLIWMTVLYFSNGEKGRKVFTVVIPALALFALLNQFVFSKSFGTLYTDLQFDRKVRFSVLLTILNVLAGLFAVAGCAWLLSRWPGLLRRGVAVIALALIGLSVWNVLIIRKDLQSTATEPSEKNAVSTYDGMLRLSRNGKNVIVFMLDRAIGSYVPYIFDEKPELKEKYQGFVLYPNTVSFATNTKTASPALFGGYEYTPTAMNARDTERLRVKHNEALLLMPLLFQKEGYSVSVCDPPYANYQDTPDLSIYDDYPDIQARNLNGRFFGEFVATLGGNDYEEKQCRNFSVYSLYRTAPLLLRNFVYDNGYYIYNLTGRNRSFSYDLINAFSVLRKLSFLTAVDDDSQNSFLLLQNETPHNPISLEPPDYRVEDGETDSSDKLEDRIFEGRVLEIRNSSHWGHYCINVATYQALADWLDYLRAEGVYDNTRIILVSDHGYYLDQFSDLEIDGLDAESFNALLMVKDFDDRDPFRIDTSFMTNADVPTLATQNVIDNPVNPFTGKAVSNEIKYQEPMIVTATHNWVVSENNVYVFDGPWWSIHDDIFHSENWAELK